MVRAFRSFIGMADACMISAARAGGASLRADRYDAAWKVDAAGYSILVRTGVHKGLELIAMLWSATGCVRTFWIVTKMARLPHTGGRIAKAST